MRTQRVAVDGMDILSTAIVLIVGILAIAIPAFLAWKYASKHRLPMKIALMGAGFFILFQIVHVPLVLLTQNPLYFAAEQSFGKAGALLALAIYLGALAALFEELGRYLVFSRFMKEKGTQPAKLFGLGWGGVESVIFVGLLATFGTFAADAFFASTDADAYRQMLVEQGVPSEEMESSLAAFEAQREAFAARGAFDPLIALYERFVAIAFHVCASILVMKSIVEKTKTGLLAALAGHFVLDAVAVMATSLNNLYLLELIVTIIVVLFALLTARMTGTNLSGLLEFGQAKRAGRKV